MIFKTGLYAIFCLFGTFESFNFRPKALNNENYNSTLAEEKIKISKFEFLRNWNAEQQRKRKWTTTELQEYCARPDFPTDWLQIISNKPLRCKTHPTYGYTLPDMCYQLINNHNNYCNNEIFNSFTHVKRWVEDVIDTNGYDFCETDNNRSNICKFCEKLACEITQLVKADHVDQGIYPVKQRTTTQKPKTSTTTKATTTNENLDTKWSCILVGQEYMKIRKNVDGDTDCAVDQGLHCFRSSDLNECENHPSNKVLTCGSHHKSIYGRPGYDTPGHWCTTEIITTTTTIATTIKPTKANGMPYGIREMGPCMNSIIRDRAIVGAMIMAKIPIKIYNIESGFYLDTELSMTSAGTNARWKKTSKNLSQQWIFTPVIEGDLEGWFMLKSYQDSSLCLNIKDQFAQLYLVPCNSADDHQLFKYREVSHDCGLNGLEYNIELKANFNQKQWMVKIDEHRKNTGSCKVEEYKEETKNQSKFWFQIQKASE